MVIFFPFQSHQEEMPGKPQMSSPPPWLRDKMFSFSSQGSSENELATVMPEFQRDPSHRDTRASEHPPCGMPLRSAADGVHDDSVPSEHSQEGPELVSIATQSDEQSIDAEMQNLVPNASVSSSATVKGHLRMETEFPATNDSPKMKHVERVCCHGNSGVNEARSSSHSDTAVKDLPTTGASENKVTEEGNRKQGKSVNSEKDGCKHDNSSDSGESSSRQGHDVSPGRELLKLKDSFNERYTIHARDGLPRIRNNLFDTDSDDSDTSHAASHNFSVASTVSLNEILEKELDEMETPMDEDFSVTGLRLVEEEEEEEGSEVTGSRPKVTSADDSTEVSESTTPCVEVPMSPLTRPLNNSVPTIANLENNIADREYNNLEDGSGPSGPRPLNVNISEREFNNLEGASGSANKVSNNDAAEQDSLSNSKMSSDSVETVLNNSKPPTMQFSPKPALKRPNSLELGRNTWTTYDRCNGYSDESDSDTDSSSSSEKDSTPTPTNGVSRGRLISSAVTSNNDSTGACAGCRSSAEMLNNQKPFPQTVFLPHDPYKKQNSGSPRRIIDPRATDRRKEKPHSLLNFVSPDTPSTPDLLTNDPLQFIYMSGLPLQEVNIKINARCTQPVEGAGCSSSGSSCSPDSAMQQSFTSSSSSDQSLRGKLAARDDGYVSNSTVSASLSDIQNDFRAASHTDDPHHVRPSSIAEHDNEVLCDFRVNHFRRESVCSNASNSSLESTTSGRGKVREMKAFFEGNKKQPPPVPPKPKLKNFIPIEMHPRSPERENAEDLLPQEQSIRIRPTEVAGASAADPVASHTEPCNNSHLASQADHTNNTQTASHHSTFVNNTTYSGSVREVFKPNELGPCPAKGASKLPRKIQNVSSEAKMNNSQPLLNNGAQQPNYLPDPHAFDEPSSLIVQRNPSFHSSTPSSLTESTTSSSPDPQTISDTCIFRPKVTYQRKCRTLKDRSGLHSPDGAKSPKKANSDICLSVRRPGGKPSKLKNVKETLIQDWKKLQQKLTNQRKGRHSLQHLRSRETSPRPGSLLPRRSQIGGNDMSTKVREKGLWWNNEKYLYRIIFMSRKSLFSYSIILDYILNINCQYWIILGYHRFHTLNCMVIYSI